MLHIPSAEAEGAGRTLRAEVQEVPRIHHHSQAAGQTETGTQEAHCTVGDIPVQDIRLVRDRHQRVGPKLGRYTCRRVGQEERGTAMGTQFYKEAHNAQLYQQTNLKFRGCLRRRPITWGRGWSSRRRSITASIARISVIVPHFPSARVDL